MCGSLQCKDGEQQPVNQEDVEHQLYSKTNIAIKGVEYECK